MKQNKRFVHNLFMRFFVPALLSSLGLAIGAVADCFYVGKMLNEDGLYIIGVASPVYMIFTTWSVALAVGGTIHFSKVLGEGDVKQGRNIFYSTIIGDFVGLCVISAAGLIFMTPLINLLGVSADSSYFMETSRYVRYMRYAVLYCLCRLHYSILYMLMIIPSWLPGLLLWAAYLTACPAIYSLS